MATEIIRFKDMRLKKRFMETLFTNVGMEIIDEARRLITQNEYDLEELQDLGTMTEIAKGVILGHLDFDDTLPQEVVDAIAGEFAEIAIAAVSRK